MLCSRLSSLPPSPRELFVSAAYAFGALRSGNEYRAEVAKLVDLLLDLIQAHGDAYPFTLTLTTLSRFAANAPTLEKAQEYVRDALTSLP